MFFLLKCLGEKSGKNLRKSGKSRGKIREFDGIKKWEPCVCMDNNEYSFY